MRAALAILILLAVPATAEIYKGLDSGACIEPSVSTERVCAFGRFFCQDVTSTSLNPVECPGTEPPPAPDADGDGIPDADDECPLDPTNTCNEPPPLVDTDGDGIPDVDDPCPADPTNTCNEPPPPPPPPSDGDYEGVPELFPLALNPGPATVIGGQVNTLSGGHFTCNGGELTGASKDQVSLGSDTVVSNCILRGHRFLGSGRNIVVMDSEIYFPTKVGVALTGENIAVIRTKVEGAGTGGNTERHGVSFGCGSKNAFVIGSTLIGNSGDGFQSGHNCANKGGKLVGIYVADTYAADNRENAYDTKLVDTFVVSESTAEDHPSFPKGEQWCYKGRCGVYSSNSDGAAIVAGSDGETTNALYVGNTIRNNGKGIRIEESPGAIIRGNTITGSSIAIEFEKEGGKEAGLFIEINDNDLGGGSIRSRFRSQNFCARGSGNVNYTLDMKNDTLACSNLTD